MELKKIELSYNEFYSQAKWFKFRGNFMLGIGILISILAVLKPNVLIMYSELSWLPLLAIIILLAGASMLIDAFWSNRTSGVLVNVQNGTADLVVGGIILANTSQSSAKLALLIAAYLIIKGILRAYIAYLAQIPHILPRMLESITSIILGYIAAMNWSMDKPWVLSLCLSIDIALRGWSTLKLGNWLSRRSS